MPRATQLRSASTRSGPMPSTARYGTAPRCWRRFAAWKRICLC
jgi:hypothetical protein